MILYEVLSSAKQLSKVEQLQLIHELAADLIQSQSPTLEAGHTYPVWSPDTAYAAAEALQRALDQPEHKS